MPFSSPIGAYGRCAHLVLALVLAVASLAPAAADVRGQSTRPAEFDVLVAKNVMVPMRDGVRLATDVYRPARDGEALPGPFPTLLSRTPYDKDGGEGQARFFASRGYAVVVQDVRGRYASEGTFYIYLHEGEDGYDAVEWAAAQPWSDGRVGTYGGSYLAATQNALAVEAPPALAGMFVVVGTSNYWEDGAGSGGAFYLLHNVAYGFSLGSTSQEAAAMPGHQAGLREGARAENLWQWLSAYPYGHNATPFEHIEPYRQWFDDWVEHQSYDDYWKQNGYAFEPYYDRYPDIPIYFVGGWYDIFLHGTLENFESLSALHSSPTRLMVGPWVHGVGPRWSGNVDFGPSAARDIRAEQLRWFDEILMGRSTGVTEGPPAQLFVMGGGDGARNAEGRLSQGGRWVGTDAWPPPEAEPTSFYLHADGSLSRERPAGSPEPTVYTYDPEDPVPTIGGKIDSGQQLTSQGPFDQRCRVGEIFGCDDDLPLSARRDVLVFQTEPLQEAVTVMGPVTVRLWISSSAPDTDFTAKLVDVHPPSEDYPWGYDMLLADRIVRARYRNSLERAELMEPGEVYEIEIDLLGTANRFEAGHRIRIDVSSSNFPFFDVNPNTGERLGHHTRTVPATNSVYHDAQRPSHVLLPVVTGDPVR